MATRAEIFLEAVDILQSGRSLDVEGEHGSGRSHFLQRIADYFVALGWRAVVVPGLTSFAKSPLVALAVAGVADVTDGRPGSIAACVKSFAESIQPGRTLIVIDDRDALDSVSDGVIRTVQTRLSVPVLSARLVHRPRGESDGPPGPFTMTYAMRLPPMGYSELETALEDALGFRTEPSTLSRVFAKSGGNIGLAAAVVDAAQRAGRFEVEDGVGRATSALWSPALRHITDVVLAPLSRDGVEALEILALLGPADLSTAAKAVGYERLGELEDRSFVSVVDVGGSSVVSIHPPLLVEHFRRDALPGRRSELLARIDDLLASGSTGDQVAPATARDSAAFVRLVHEHTRRRTLQAREAWQTSPSLLTAKDLLTALELDGVHGFEEIDALVKEVHGLTGTDRERAEWLAALLSLRAVRNGDPRVEVAELRAVAPELGRESGIPLARAVELEVSFLTTADSDPLEAVDTKDMSTKARAAILRARTVWMIARGLHEEADRTLAEWRALASGHDPFAEAITVFTHILGDRMDVAVRVADAALVASQRSFDAPSIRTNAYLAALAALLDRRLEDAERILEESSFLGLPSPFPPNSYIGLKTLAAELAARRGQRGLMEQLLADVDATGLPDGPFLGQNGGLARARLAEVEDGLDDAAAAALESGDVLWERGALFTAAASYLHAVAWQPTAELWERVGPRITAVQAPLVVRRADVVKALVERDAAELIRLVTVADAEGHERDGDDWAALGIRVLGDALAAEDLAALSNRAPDARTGTATSTVALLTPREREVAELVAAGLSNSVIAEALVLSVRTVESHVNRLLRKTGLHRRQDVRGFILGSTPGPNAGG